MEQENTSSSPPYILFYSYSHKDEELKNLLEKQLVMLRRSGLIREWHDRKILPGEEWDKQISRYLDAAKIILLLISSDFLASEYCYDIEAKRALERYDRGDACLIPIILRPVMWELTPFSRIQALPKNALPVKQWDDLDSAFVNVCEGILAVIMTLKSGGESGSGLRSFKSSPEPRPLASQTLSRKRVLDAAIPDRVAVEKAISVVAMIRRQDSEGLRKILKVNDHYGMSEKDVFSTDSFPLDFPLDSEGEPQPLDLTIKIESPDFEPKTQSKGIRIQPRGDTDPRIFLLTPKREGDLFVNVELYKNDLLLSGCLLETKASQTELETQSVNLTSVALKSENEMPQPSPPSPASYNSQDTVLAGGYPPIANYSGANSQNYENKISLPLSHQPPSPQSLSPFSNDTDAAYGNAVNAPYSNVNPQAKSSKRGKFLIGTAALVGLVFPAVVGLIVFTSLNSGDVSVNTNTVFNPNSNTSLPALNQYNESQAIATLRLLTAALNQYSEKNKASKNFESGGADILKALNASGLINDSLVNGKQSGYIFDVKAYKKSGRKVSFDITAEPSDSELNPAALKSFYTNESQTIFYSKGIKAGNRRNPGVALK